MTTYTLGFRLAQAIGLSGAAWLSGGSICAVILMLTPLIIGTIASISNITIPALLQSYREDKVPASMLVKQWKRLYGVGKSKAPPIAATIAASFVYLAWSVRPGTPLFKQTPYSRSGVYLAAAVLTVGIVPFTRLAMAPTNGAISKLVDSDVQLDGDEVVELVEKWSVLNRVRSVFPLVAGLCAFAASLL